jgi:sugar lactone lactonase YvrE
VILEGDRIVQPPRTSGNALAHMPDGGFVLTSMFDPTDPDFLSKFAQGQTTGGVWHWTSGNGWSRFGSLELSGANGIAATLDGSAVYVSEWSARRIWRLGSGGEPVGHAQTLFLPDNLRWTSDGKLLLAGQASRPELMFGCEARGEPYPLAFEVAVVDPDTMMLESQVRADERQAKAWGFGGATGALEVDGELWVGSFTGERIAKFRRRSP